MSQNRIVVQCNNGDEMIISHIEKDIADYAIKGEFMQEKFEPFTVDALVRKIKEQDLQIRKLQAAIDRVRFALEG